MAVTKRRSLVRNVLIIIEDFALAVPSPFGPSSPPRIQRTHIPQRNSIETSTRLYPTRLYGIYGTRRSSAVVDEPRRSTRECSRGQVFEEHLIHFLD